MAKYDLDSLNFSSRKEGGRDKNPPKRIKNIALDDIQKRFDESMNDVENLFNVCTSLKENNLPGAEDIYRAQILFLDSSLDFYIHEITKYGLVQIVDPEVSGWNVNDEFKKFKVSINFLKRVYSNREDIKVILKELNDTIQYSSYMKFEAVSSQLDLIGLEKPEGFENYRYVIDGLSDRRNAIAHASDRDMKGDKTDIDETTVRNFMEKLKEFQKLIHEAVKNK